MVRNSRRRDGRYVRAEVVGPSSLRGGRRRGGRLFFFSSRRRHTRYWPDWSSDVCSSDLGIILGFDADGGLLGVIAGLALVTAFAFGLAWIFTTIGLIMRTPNAVLNAGFMALFPIKIGRASCRERV